MQRTTLGLILIMTLALSFPLTEAEQGRQQLDSSPRVIEETKNCPVCNMYPARYPKWQAQIVFKNGSYHAFDGCKHMFRVLFHLEKYDKHQSRKDVVGAWVKDFNTGKWIEAEEAHYVADSGVLGPMGRELIPFGTHKAAVKFQRERGGEMLHFADVNLELLQSLDTGKMPMKHDKMKHKH